MELPGNVVVVGINDRPPLVLHPWEDNGYGNLCHWCHDCGNHDDAGDNARIVRLFDDAIAVVVAAAAVAGYCRPFFLHNNRNQL